MPRVSIGMPVYNGEEYVSEAVESLLAQTFRDFELVIVDNASTDRTSDIARAFAARDARVRYHRNPVNIGGAPNFIRAVELANGAPYFKWAAHDDRHAPEYLEKCVALLDANPDVIVCHSDVEIIDGDGQVVVEPDPELLAAARAFDLTDVASDRPSLRFRNLVLSEHMGLDQFGVFRRAELIKTPLIAAYVGSDRVMLAEIGLRGKMRRVPQVLFQNRDFSGRSMRVAPLRARVGWFNPKRAGAIVLPYWRYLLEYNRSIVRVPLPHSERVACWRTLVDWVRVNRWQMQKDVRFAVQRLREEIAAPTAAPRP
jgi:glycosyltransferase involved in cell wall biosynthesis